jgi:hypothetical protein
MSCSINRHVVRLKPLSQGGVCHDEEASAQIVFILYQHPDAFSSVPHNLANDLVERFQRYFKYREFSGMTVTNPNPHPNKKMNETLFPRYLI